MALFHLGVELKDSPWKKWYLHCEDPGKGESGETFSWRHFMKNGNGGGRNSSVRQEVLEEAGLPKVHG